MQECIFFDAEHMILDARGIVAPSGMRCREDVALAGFNTMVSGVPQETLTSQGLQAAGAPQAWANGIDAGISIVGTVGVGAAAGGATGRVVGVASERTEIVQRAMSKAEFQNIRQTGLLSRDGRLGNHYVSDAVNSTANRARQRLALPVQPEVRVTIEVPYGVFSSPAKVQPYVLPNGLHCLVEVWSE